MGSPFSDITLYTQTPHTVGTPEYWEETSLKNYISDLYVQNMNGYKPPKTSRITIQPFYHEIWKRTWKNGSIVHIAPYYNYEEYTALNTNGKYKYILDVIQDATLQLCDEYHWDRSVFENAYNKVLESNFKFKIDYTPKQSRDRTKVGVFSITKNETITSAYIHIQTNGQTITKKLFDKKNAWCYDCVYFLARNNKWFDTDRFGIAYGKGKIEIWYSLDKNKVELFENGQPVSKIDFTKFFLFN